MIPQLLPATPYDLRFRLAGIPVRVHPLFWLVSLLLGLGPSGGIPAEVLTWMAAVFVSILVHEMGHALAARSFRQRPSITLYAWGGLASYTGPGMTRGARIAVTLAGPGAGFLFAAVVTAALYLLGSSVSFKRGLLVPGPIRMGSEHLWTLAFFLLYINVWWGLINLLPIQPLDGGHVAQELLTARRANGLRESYWLSLITAGAVAAYGAIVLGDWFLMLFFGYLAVQSYLVLQAMHGDGRSSWR